MSGCAARARAVRAGGDEVAHYRGRLEARDGRRQAFRALVFAALPDRLHVEVLSPIGTPEIVLDAGGGQAAVSMPSERVVFAGAAQDGPIARLLGVPLSLESFVRLVLTGEPPPATAPAAVDADDELRWHREPSDAPGLPDRLTLEHAGLTLSFERRGRRVRRALDPSVGTGSPPPGFWVRPLDELEPLLDRAAPESAS